MGKKIKNFWNFTNSSGEAKILTIQIVVGAILTLASTFIFAKIADHVVDKEAILFDSQIIKIVYLFRTPFTTTIMKAFTFFGGEIFLSAAILITIAAIYKEHKKDALIFGFILFFGIILNLMLKDAFQRPRPNFQPLVHETSYSFPSGHSMNSFIFYTSVSYFIFRKAKNKKVGYFLITISILLIGAVGLSRIYLGAHYPSDVAGGYAAGLIWFAAILVFEKILIVSNMFRKYEIEKGYKINLYSG